MKKIKITRNPYLLFVPFLVLYIIVVLIFDKPGTRGDEGRYLMFAKHIIEGFYSPPAPNIDLGNGPGYPIVLTPFVALHLPLICITLLNAGFYYLSIVLLFKSLKNIVSFKVALAFSLFWACFLNLYEYLYRIYTEVFTAFLICLLIFYVNKAFRIYERKNDKMNIFFSGFILGFIALTKPIFGYVILVMLIGNGLAWITKRKSVNIKKGFFILLTAFLTTTPYLIYSYHLTNRALYWGTNAGNNLYWMSSPYEGEYGSWLEYPAVADSVAQRIPGSQDIIELRHQKDFAEITKYKSLKQDDLLKKMTIENIKSHPIKFLENCFSNVGRMLFNFPYSYKIEKPATLLRLPLTGIIVFLSIFCLFLTMVNWRKLYFPIKFLLFITFIYLGGSILGSAETRMFTMIVPVLLFWIAFTMERSVKINLKLESDSL
jgi:hypothetical protein